MHALGRILGIRLFGDTSIQQSVSLTTSGDDVRMVNRKDVSNTYKTTIKLGNCHMDKKKNTGGGSPLLADRPCL